CVQQRKDRGESVVGFWIVVDRVLVVFEAFFNQALRDGYPAKQQVKLGFQVDIFRARVHIPVNGSRWSQLSQFLVSSADLNCKRGVLGRVRSQISGGICFQGQFVFTRLRLQV